MISLYQWLIEVKGYSEAEASETVDRWEMPFELPVEVKKDILEYTREYITHFKG